MRILLVDFKIFDINMEPRSFLETPIAPFTVPSIGYPNKSSPQNDSSSARSAPQKNLVHQNIYFFILVQEDPVIVQFNFSFSLQMLLPNSQISQLDIPKGSSRKAKAKQN